MRTNKQLYAMIDKHCANNTNYILEVVYQEVYQNNETDEISLYPELGEDNYTNLGNMWSGWLSMPGCLDRTELIIANSENELLNDIYSTSVEPYEVY